MSDDRLLRLERLATVENAAPEDVYRYRVECLRAGRPELAGFWAGDRVEWFKKDREGRPEAPPWDETAPSWGPMWVWRWDLASSSEVAFQDLGHGHPLPYVKLLWKRAGVLLGYENPHEKMRPYGWNFLQVAMPEDCVLREVSLCSTLDQEGTWVPVSGRG